MDGRLLQRKSNETVIKDKILMEDSHLQGSTGDSTSNSYVYSLN